VNKKDYYLLVQTSDAKAVLSIDESGELKYMRNGKLVVAKNDSDLNLAFAGAIMAMAGKHSEGLPRNVVVKAALEGMKKVLKQLGGGKP
jgi:hypothetical protein